MHQSLRIDKIANSNCDFVVSWLLHFYKCFTQMTQLRLKAGNGRLPKVEQQALGINDKRERLLIARIVPEVSNYSLVGRVTLKPIQALCSPNEMDVGNPNILRADVDEIRLVQHVRLTSWDASSRHELN
jgi:hypothetical protein